MQPAKCDHCGAEQFEKSGFMIIKHDSLCQELAKLRVEFFENFPNSEPTTSNKKKKKKSGVMASLDDTLQRVKDVFSDIAQ